MDRQTAATLAREACAREHGRVLSIERIVPAHPEEAEYAEWLVEVEYMHPGLLSDLMPGRWVVSPGPSLALYGVEGGKAVCWQS
jgi:hypothetical protein